MPTTVVTIAGVAYDKVGRPAARVRPDTLELSLDGGFDSFAFSEIGGSPVPSWADGDTVSVTWVRDDLSEHLVFSGRVDDVSHTPTPEGWVISYQALSSRHRCDHVPVTNFDRTGSISFNRSPEDPEYTADEAGLTVGEIITILLTVVETATALDALGVGGYTDLDPVTLPSATVADLAVLDAVPATQVVFQGEGVVDQIDQFLQHWMPSRALRVEADGTIRFLDTRDVGPGGAFVPVDVTLPNATTGGDPVTWPSLRRSTARCATRVVIRGAAEVEAAMLSTFDGTLAKVWSPTEQSNWTYSDFTQPKDAYSEGSVTSMTGNSAVLDPDDAARAWGSNFWSGREATLFLYAPLGTGLTMTLTRPVTANAALTAGGTASVTWDAAWPADSTGYTKYKLIGGAGGNAEVGRLYEVREPHTGDTGLDTLIGAHLVRRSPLPIKVANNSGYISVHYPQGFVWQNAPDEDPGMELPLNVEVIPTLGRFRFYEPIVNVFGDPADLESGYPTTRAGGLPGDVRVIAMYSRGTLEAIAPANSGVGHDVPEYDGTAHSIDGIAITKTIDLPAWTNRGDHPRLLELAQQYLDVLKDVVYEGQCEYYGEPPWDWWAFSTAINFLCPPHTGLWEDMNAPIRSVRLSWPQNEGMRHKFALGFSNRRRPHSGDDLYLPAAFSYQGLDTSGAVGVMNGTPVSGIDSGMGWVGNVAAAGMAAMNNTANQGVNSANSIANQATSAMNDAANQGMGAMNAGASQGIGNALDGTPGGPQQVDPAAMAMGMPPTGGRSNPGGAARGPRGEVPRGIIDQHPEMMQKGAEERARIDRGEPPAARPKVTLPPHESTANPVQLHEGPREPVNLPPRVPTEGERQQSERGRDERSRIDRGVPLPPPEVSTLPPREPTEGQAEQAGRGRQERRRLHPEEGE